MRYCYWWITHWALKSMIFMVHREKMFSSWKKTPVFSGCWTHSTVSINVTGHSYEIWDALMDWGRKVKSNMKNDYKEYENIIIDLIDVCLPEHSCLELLSSLTLDRGRADWVQLVYHHDCWRTPEETSLPGSHWCQHWLLEPPGIWSGGRSGIHEAHRGCRGMEPPHPPGAIHHQAEFWSLHPPPIYAKLFLFRNVVTLIFVPNSDNPAPSQGQGHSWQQYFNIVSHSHKIERLISGSGVSHLGAGARDILHLSAL